MPQDDEMQVGVFYFREPVPGQASLPIEMGGGEGNLVRLWGAHWNFELVDTTDNVTGFVGVALSSNPEHELTPLINFEDFQFNKALYSRELFVYEHVGAGDSTIWRDTKIVPLYGLVRPRRQVMVISQIAPAVDAMGFGLELYYQAFSAPKTEREEVNRKYGKYRRS